APGSIVAVKVRVDVLDNLAIGGSADGIPGGSITQRVPESAFRIKRAYGEVITPIGYFGAGRMGHDWGLGMMGNSGDCADCDSGDAADRVAYVTAALDHLFVGAYDFSSTGHLIPLEGSRQVDVEPAAGVRSMSFAILRWRDDAARRRRNRAGKLTPEYGVYVGHRWQNKDVPASYLPLDNPVEIDAAQVVDRGLRAWVVDGYFQLTHPWFRLGLEGAFVDARIEQASTIPGMLLPQPVLSRQWGGVVETELGAPGHWFTTGFDAGVASGDPAPGFGAQPALQGLYQPEAGDINGPQVAPPGDWRVDNFRFHPDYRVDRILFRELIGTVTDAMYVRPHVSAQLLDFGNARLKTDLAVIASWALTQTSAPGEEHPLGVEFDPSLVYHRDDGFAAMIEYAALLPGKGLDNPDLGLKATPAQLVRLHLAYGF
ncbi:MAG: hypothetical protein HN348_27300, partial [Proteobacteria bacterium]|nr:hypothetical protein [Pseudomonadota bacterium]